VIESGLHRFGSSRPDDAKSPPAASMTWQTLWAFRMADGRPQLGIITNSRSGLKPMNELLGMLEAKKAAGIDHYFLRFKINAVRLSPRPGEYFFGYRYLACGHVQDEAEGDVYKAIFERYLKAGFSGDLSQEDDGEVTPPPPRQSMYNKQQDDPDEIPF